MPMFMEHVGVRLPKAAFAVHLGSLALILECVQHVLVGEGAQAKRKVSHF